MSEPLLRVPRSTLSDDDMRVHASCRGLVELTNGSIVHLLAWRPNRRARPDGRPRSRRQQARVYGQKTDASAAGSVHTRDVVAAVFPAD